MISDKRLNEMITGMKPYAEMPYGIKINEFSAKDLYLSLQELEERRESELRPATKFLGAKPENQFTHIVSEQKEVAQALSDYLYKCFLNQNPGEIKKAKAQLLDELNDLKISATTMSAMIEPDEQKQREAMKRTIAKNAARGYYDEA